MHLQKAKRQDMDQIHLAQDIGPVMSLLNAAKKTSGFTKC
jgi:hypothetical protein